MRFENVKKRKLKKKKMESHVNEYSEVKEALLLEVKRSEPMKDSGSLRRRRRRDPHSGTSGSEFTATTGISEAKKKPSNRRHDSESDVERQLLEAMMEIVGLKEILGLKVLYFTHSNYSFSKFFFAFLFLLL
ncbi:PREDICTED: uncharacterized protein LOC18607162 isoform X2 [Theobroma cacao]|uniref:Uncharacterized protein LOC18607162 isoform X2 n=1 Tax=Theobroma cacao TaxID=3641 RepID=A0AB32VY23_THECC|nr:PREDICTED: uncharacterized protein LOC18607162 isoform X2 [Theobroma cacao]